MATIGQSLFEPESGWKRIDNEDLRIIYNGNFTTVTSTSHYNGSIKSIENNIKNNSIEFYLRSNRLRLISYVSSDTSYSNNVNINIDGVDYTSTLSLGITRYRTLVADINIHNLRTHKIIITDKSNSPRGLNIDAIDVDEDGELIDSATYYSTIDSMKGMFEGCTSLTKDGRIPLHINNVQELYKNCTGMTHIISNWKNPYDNPDIISTDCYAGCNNIQFVDNIPVEDGLDEIPIEWGGRGFDKTVTGIYRVFIPSDNYTFVFESTNYLMDDKVVKWGDGTSTQGELSHTYRYAGEYIIKGKIQMLYQGVNPCVSMRNCCTEVIQYPTEGNTWGAFVGMSKVTKINVTGNKLTNKVNGVELCFAYCASLSEIIGLETWDVSSFTNFNRMFYGTKVTNTSFNISNWNLNKAVNLGGIFNSCTMLVNPPITNIPDTVTNISEMYRGCTSLTNVDGMTFGSGITNCTNWIYGCTNLVSANNITLRCFTNDGNNALFQNCTTLLQANNITIESSVYKIAYMFKSCSNLQSISFSNTVNDTIQNVQNAFYGCSKLVNFNWGAISLINCNNVDGMFYGCSSLTQITMPQLHPSQPIRFVNAFYGTSKLTSVEFYPSPITLTWCGRIFMSSSVTSISNFIIADVSDTSQVDSLRFPNTNLIFNNVQVLSNKAVQIFQGTPIKSIIGDGLKIGFGVTDASTLFNGCSNLTSVTLKDYNNSSLIPPTTMPSTLTQITFNGTYNRTAIQNILKSCPWQINVVYGDTIPTTLITKDINMNKSSETQFTNLLEGSSKTLEVYGNTIQNLVTNPDNTEETCRYIYSGSGESFTINDTVDSKIRIDEIQGNTVQNWFDSSNYKQTGDTLTILSNGNYCLTSSGTPLEKNRVGVVANNFIVKANTTYTAFFELVNIDDYSKSQLTNGIDKALTIMAWCKPTTTTTGQVDKATIITNNINRKSIMKFTTNSDSNYVNVQFSYYFSDFKVRWMEFKNFAILEGDYSTKSYEDIFKMDNMDGIRSVGIPVENPNLFDETVNINTNAVLYTHTDGTAWRKYEDVTGYRDLVTNFVFETNCQYTISCEMLYLDVLSTNVQSRPSLYIAYTGNNNVSRLSFNREILKITNPVNTTLTAIQYRSASDNKPMYIRNIQIQKGTVATPYYPKGQELYNVTVDSYNEPSYGLSQIINKQFYSNYCINASRHKLPNSDSTDSSSNYLHAVSITFKLGVNAKTGYIFSISQGNATLRYNKATNSFEYHNTFIPILNNVEYNKVYTVDIIEYLNGVYIYINGIKIIGTFPRPSISAQFFIALNSAYITTYGQGVDDIFVYRVKSTQSPIASAINESSCVTYLSSKSLILPCQLQGLNTNKDKLYWDTNKSKWCVEKKNNYVEFKSVFEQNLDWQDRWSCRSPILNLKAVVGNEVSGSLCVSNFPSIQNYTSIYRHLEGTYYIFYVLKTLYSDLNKLNTDVPNIKLLYMLNTSQIIELPYTNQDLLELNTYSTQTNIYSNAGINPNLVINSNGVSRDVMLKPSTAYTVNYTSDKDISIDLGGTKINALSSETKKLITTPATLTHGEVRFANTNAKLKNISVVEGDYMAEDDFNYFEGIQSVGEYDSASGKYKVEVKSGAKNLFDMGEGNVTRNPPNEYGRTQTVTFANGEMLLSASDQACVTEFKTEFKKGVTYTISFDIILDSSSILPENSKATIMIMPKNILLNDMYTSRESIPSYNMNIYSHYKKTFTPIQDSVLYLGGGDWNFRNTVASRIKNLQIEIGSTETPYIPYGQNIKTFLLDEPLRKIGDVADRLYWDSNKGYYCVERKIGTFKLDSLIENAKFAVSDVAGYKTEYYSRGTLETLIDYSKFYSTMPYICDKFFVSKTNSSTYNFFVYFGSNDLRVCIKNTLGVTTADFVNLYLDMSPNYYYNKDTITIQDLPTYNQNVGLLRIWQDKTVIDTSNIIKPSNVKFVVKDIT